MRTITIRKFSFADTEDLQSVEYPEDFDILSIDKDGLVVVKIDPPFQRQHSMEDILRLAAEGE